jgi:hypothetical protein
LNIHAGRRSTMSYAWCFSFYLTKREEDEN